ncbi:MAG: chromate transporter [Paludibacteraceae bacterium]|nr:chromate transporter [Paludibacteraceae bacterium]
MIYLQLFLSFLKIGLFGFGGGLAIFSLIQHEIEVHGWMTQEEFVDILAVSQVTPGPIGINCATYVGYTATGNVWGSLLATTAIIIPSLIIMLSICKVYFIISTRFQHNIYFNRTMHMLRLSVLGMIGAAALLLMKPVGQPSVSFIDWRSWAIFAVVCVFTILPMFFKKFDSNGEIVQKKSTVFFKTVLNIASHPIILIILAGVAGYCIYS